MESEARLFREEVYSCCNCANLGLGFTRLHPNLPFFKFPHTIGAKGKAPLLFIGINPRISNTNRWLHKALMTNRKVFHDLAGNLYERRNYIAIDGMEPHYNTHALIASEVFPGKSFEEIAAVTELFLCAKETSSELPIVNSPCAEKYLERTLRQVRPKIIIPVGKQVLRYLQVRFGKREEVFSIEKAGSYFSVIPMSHPAPRAPKIWTTEWTIKKILAAFSRY